MAEYVSARILTETGLQDKTFDWEVRRTVFGTLRRMFAKGTLTIDRGCSLAKNDSADLSTAAQQRLGAQRPYTSIGRHPVVGLVIRTDNARALERALHSALDRAASRMGDAVGEEWFETTPQKIKEWYSGYVATIGVLRRQGSQPA